MEILSCTYCQNIWSSWFRKNSA